MCCTRLSGNTGRKNDAKNHHLRTIAQLYRAVFSQWRHVSTIRKKTIKQQYLFHTFTQYGELWSTNGWDRFGSLGHPCCRFQRVSCLGFVTAATSLNGGQQNFARCLAISSTGTPYTHFRGLLSPDGILPRAKFTLHPSLAFSCTGSVTTLHSNSGRQPNFAAPYNEWNYGTLADGVTFIWLGGHHIGNWLTF